VNALALELRERRATAAPGFAVAVAVELHDVGMGEGEFTCEVRERDMGATGADEAVFLIRPNAGMPFGPVAETASGGELSRVALAIAAVAGGETLVFDEIDAGIGGETANAVGRVLKRLAERAQVITITHLPQIAAVADRHFRVEKIPGDPTHTRIEQLGEDERKAELERMLGGQEFLAAVRS
jgi:DNA repair protein RecN (Recombination protein N)